MIEVSSVEYMTVWIDGKESFRPIRKRDEEGDQPEINEGEISYRCQSKVIISKTKNSHADRTNRGSPRRW